ncbi:MAG: FAD-dependent oxidoreductase, partial [Acidimicrobiales bacterium]
MTVRFVVVGGGPAGTQAATWGARLGAEVTVVEKEVLGG